MIVAHAPIKHETRIGIGTSLPNAKVMETPKEYKEENHIARMAIVRTIFPIVS